MFHHDFMRHDVPAAKAEMDLLKTTKVGDIRRGTLFPALDVGMEWICRVAKDPVWEFEGLFFGQPVYHVVITSTPESVSLDLKELQP
jgi:hypothetical protein